MQLLKKIRRERYQKMISLMPQHLNQKANLSFYYPSNQNLVPLQTSPSNKIQNRSKKKINSTMMKQTYETKSRKNNTKMKTSITSRFAKKNIQKQSIQKRFQTICSNCSKQNIAVQYYNSHICINCRQYIKTQDGDKAKIFLDQGNIIALGVMFQNDKKIYYAVDHNELYLNGKKCYATLAGKNKLVVIFF